MYGNQGSTGYHGRIVKVSCRSSHSIRELGLLFLRCSWCSCAFFSPCLMGLSRSEEVRCFVRTVLFCLGLQSLAMIGDFLSGFHGWLPLCVLNWSFLAVRDVVRVAESIDSGTGTTKPEPAKYLTKSRYSFLVRQTTNGTYNILLLSKSYITRRFRGPETTTIAK